MYKHDEWRLHVTVTHETHMVASKHDANTIVGVDVNEDCIALVAMSRGGSVKDSVVFEYPSVKEQRHEFFTEHTDVIWEPSSHVNPVFSRDGSRLYYTKPVGPNTVQM